MPRVTHSKTFAVVLLMWAALAAVKASAQNHATPWIPIRDNDILWKKCVMRELDICRLQNKALRSGGNIKANQVFANILLVGITERKLIAYADTQCHKPLSPEAIDALVACDPLTLSANNRMYLNYIKAHPDSAMDLNLQLPEKKRLQKGYLDRYDSSAVSNCVFPQQVDCYDIIEDWIFDRNQGKMLVRIRSIAPAIKVGGDKKILFWIKYPEWRDYLSNFDIPIANNEKQLSWEEYFEARQFSSIITCILTDAKSDSLRKKGKNGWVY